MKYSLIAILVIIASLISSCTNEAPKVKLSRSENVLVDSLYKDEIMKTKLELDSICEVRNKEQYQRIKDSIISVRLSEIEQFLPNN